MKRNKSKKNQFDTENSGNEMFHLLNQLKTCQIELITLKNSQRKRIVLATLAAKESERNISRTLHDSVCQLLYGIKLNLQSIHDLRHSKTELNKVSMLIDQAIKEMRDISHSLTPAILKDFGFTAGIKEMTNRLNTKHFKINALINAALDYLPSDVQLNIFRIVQELVNNCIKHSSASKVLITLGQQKDIIRITVKDNGKGFNPNAIKTLSKGSGLKSIKNQALLLNGELTIESSINGTIVCLTFKNNLSTYN